MLDTSSVTKRKIPTIATVEEKRKPHFGEPENQSPSRFPLLLFLLVVGVLGGYYLISGTKKSPIVIDEHGNKSLAPHRQEKRDKELWEINNAMQYVLLAEVDGYYPCETCPNGAKTIFLYAGEIWKYGVTRIGEKRRYPGGDYGASNVVYLPQFEGTYSECLSMEKTKIYDYPLLPEATKEGMLLIRPPGNAKDS